MHGTVDLLGMIVDDPSPFIQFVFDYLGMVVDDPTPFYEFIMRMLGG